MEDIPQYWWVTDNADGRLPSHIDRFEHLLALSGIQMNDIPIVNISLEESYDFTFFLQIRQFLLILCGKSFILLAQSRQRKCPHINSAFRGTSSLQTGHVGGSVAGGGVGGCACACTELIL